MEDNVKNCILGMDIGGTNIRMGLVDKQGKAAFVEVVPSRSVYQMENTLDGLCSVIDQYCKKHLGENRPLLVAAGFPSVVDKERRRLYSSTNCLLYTSKGDSLTAPFLSCHYFSVTLSLFCSPL